MYVVKERRNMTSFYSFIYDFQFQKWVEWFNILNILKTIACKKN